MTNADTLAIEKGLEVLGQITERIVDFKELVVKRSPSFFEVKTPEGECFAWRVMERDGQIKVSEWFNSARSSLPIHCHKEKTWIIVYSGSAVITINGKEQRLGKGDSCALHPETEYATYFPEDCRYISVNIPSSDDAP